MTRRRLDYVTEKQRAIESVLRYWEYTAHHIEMILINNMIGRGGNKIDVNLYDKKGK